eukprot:m.295615 g.295615  ORF g.295615 m.295615 type:complete len:419 (+) comp13229_c0_seq1:261-1517(+)
MASASAATAGAGRSLLVIGGGNAAHVLVALGTRAGMNVRVLTTFGDEAARWQASMAAAGGLTATVTATAEEVVGHAEILADPEAAVRGVDTIIMSLPANFQEPYLRSIAPFLAAPAPGKTIHVGAMPGYAFFGLCAQRALGDKADLCTFFALETLPWACRFSAYGSAVDILGTKKAVELAVASHDENEVQNITDEIQAILGKQPELFVGKGGFLGLTLMNINSVWHPNITFGAYRNWDFQTPFAEKPLFYEGVDEWTGNQLAAVSDEILKCRDELTRRFGVNLDDVVHVSEWMRRSYAGDMADESSLAAMIRSNRGYKGLTHSVLPSEDPAKPGWLPNFGHRYMSEDIPMGLVPTRGVCELAGIATPHMDDTIRFAERALKKEYLIEGKLAGKDVADTRAPQAFGFSKIEDLMAALKF